jgi:hypothetical protein
MKSKTTDKWTEHGKKVQRYIKQLRGKPYVKVGILEQKFDEAKDSREKSKSENTLGQVAVANEFGTDQIPERSFLRSTADKKAKVWADQTEKYRKQVMEGHMTPEQALGLLGLKIETDTKTTIRSNVPPPNSPATVARKGSSKTLIDTGQLLNAIAPQVVMERKE